MGVRGSKDVINGGIVECTTAEGRDDAAKGSWEGDGRIGKQEVLVSCNQWRSK